MGISSLHTLQTHTLGLEGFLRAGGQSVKVSGGKATFQDLRVQPLFKVRVGVGRYCLQVLPKNRRPEAGALYQLRSWNHSFLEAVSV